MEAVMDIGISGWSRWGVKKLKKNQNHILPSIYLTCSPRSLALIVQPLIISNMKFVLAFEYYRYIFNYVSKLKYTMQYTYNTQQYKTYLNITLIL